MSKCEKCMWYFPCQKLCYLKWEIKDPNATCPDHTTDKGLNYHAELTRECDC
jgi:hypothetical protein